MNHQRAARRGARRSTCWALCAACLLGACAVGPDFERPEPPKGARFDVAPVAAAAPLPDGSYQQIRSELDLPAQWWTMFHSEPLNALVKRALLANADLAAADAGLRAAHENELAAQAAFFPTLQASYTPQRQRDPVGTLAPTLNSGAPIFNLYNAQVSVGYVFDVFGGTRRQVESLAAQAEQQRFEYEAALLTVTSNVTTAAIQTASLNEQIAANEKVVSILADEVELANRAEVLGQLSQADVSLLDAQLASAQASLAPLRRALVQEQDLMRALVGAVPGETVDADFRLAELQLPAEVPLSLPSQLVAQRPDVRAAEASLHAATAAVGVATANLLPQFALTGSAGGTATQMSQLFAPGNVFWNLAGNFSETVFDGGALWHRRKAAVALMDQAAAAYRSTVIDAFQNVADALAALQHDGDALAANARAEAAAARSLSLARTQERLGSISTLTLLATEQNYQLALVNLAQARAARFTDTVALYQALGGGWWNRDGVAAAQPADGGAALTSVARRAPTETTP